MRQVSTAHTSGQNCSPASVWGGNYSLGQIEIAASRSSRSADSPFSAKLKQIWFPACRAWTQGASFSAADTRFGELPNRKRRKDAGDHPGDWPAREDSEDNRDGSQFRAFEPLSAIRKCDASPNPLIRRCGKQHKRSALLLGRIHRGSSLNDAPQPLAK